MEELLKKEVDWLKSISDFGKGGRLLTADQRGKLLKIAERALSTRLEKGKQEWLRKKANAVARLHAETGYNKAVAKKEKLEAQVEEAKTELLLTGFTEFGEILPEWQVTDTNRVPKALRASLLAQVRLMEKMIGGSYKDEIHASQTGNKFLAKLTLVKYPQEALTILEHIFGGKF